MAMQTGVIDLLLRDHQKVETMLGELDSLPLSGLDDYFCQLREELVRHEVAEEVVVYPVFRERVPGGDAIADERIREQSEAEEELAAMEKEDRSTEAFRTQLRELRAAVLEHAQHEERSVFSALGANLSHEELHHLGERYERALSSAPTHPHPHAPDTPPGNIIAGPVAKIIDTFRDAMRRAA